MNVSRLVFGRFVEALRPFIKTKSLYHLPVMSTGKIVSPEFHALITPELLEVESVFKSAGYNIRLVGGVVRDLLLGLPAKDIDIATECNPKVMMKLLRNAGFRCIPTGLDHGTVTVLRGDSSYEVSINAPINPPTVYSLCSGSGSGWA